MKTSTLAMPAALVLSSLILAIGWNLGPGSSRTPAPIVAAPIVAASPTPTIQAPAPAAPAPVPVMTTEIRERGAVNARSALESWRPRLRAECWDPAVAKVREPSSITLDYYLSFSPEGALVATGIIENRRAFRTDVSQCLRGVALDLRIPAPGLPLQVQVPFSLP
jgi:hypothetical protein